MPHLIIIDKDKDSEDAKTWVPADRPFTIGRGKASSLRIRDVKMSRVHCELSVSGGVTTLTDLNSMNGTFVNGQRVTSVTVKDGDIIQAGYTRFRYDESDVRRAVRLAEPEPEAELVELVEVAEEIPPPPEPAPEEEVAFLEPEPPDGPDDAAIVASLGIVRQERPRPLKKGEKLCSSCQRPVTARQLKSDAATDIHGQVCCPECIEGDPLIGKTVAGCRVDAKLGAGAWSATYKAEQLSMARSVVLRAVKPEVSSDPELVTQFLATVKRSGQISHPNLVRIYDLGRTSELCYASVEYIDGESVKLLLSKKPGFSVEAGTRIIAGVASAVDIAHRRDVFHRDIRPANIILNDEKIPKLIGLGFATTIEDAAAAGSIKVQYAADLVRYWAPERLEDPARGGAQADVYSLGAVLYAMLAGRPAFDVADPVKLIGAIRGARPKPLDALRDDVPHRLSAVIAKAMAKSPDDRHTDCQQFIQDLREAIR